MTTYFLDEINGKDYHNGKSFDKAFRTYKRVCKAINYNDVKPSIFDRIMLWLKRLM